MGFIHPVASGFTSFHFFLQVNPAVKPCASGKSGCQASAGAALPPSVHASLPASCEAGGRHKERTQDPGLLALGDLRLCAQIALRAGTRPTDSLPRVSIAMALPKELPFLITSPGATRQPLQSHLALPPGRDLRSTPVARCEGLKAAVLSTCTSLS